MLAAHDIVIQPAQLFGHRPDLSRPNLAPVHFANGDDLDASLSDRSIEKVLAFGLHDYLDLLQWPRDALLYARVDLVHGDNGQPFLLEVELTEPSMFLGYGEGAAGRLAAAIARRIAG